MNIRRLFQQLRTTPNGFLVLQIVYMIVFVGGLLLSGLLAVLNMPELADMLETFAVYSFALIVINSVALAVGLVLFGNKTIFPKDSKIFPWER